MKKVSKNLFVEFFDPIKNYLRMNEIKDIIILILIPLIIGVTSFIVGISVEINKDVKLIDFMSGILENFITVIALFISFSMAYLSIIMSSNSENINQLKGSYSEKFKDLNENFYTLYQILVTEITYTLVIEILFLIICIVERFLINCISNIFTKILGSLDIAIFIYILFLMMQIVKDIYFSFWKSK